MVRFTITWYIAWAPSVGTGSRLIQKAEYPLMSPYCNLTMRYKCNNVYGRPLLPQETNPRTRKQQNENKAEKKKNAPQITGTVDPVVKSYSKLQSWLGSLVNV
jgi:hypothetical protein